MIHVVIIGGGFAGTRLVRKLRGKRDISITLVNDSPEMKYYPAMYRAATGYKMATANLSLDWALLDISNVHLVVSKLLKVNENERSVILENGETIKYDYLVIGIGSVTTFFKIEGLHEHAFGMKSEDEILELKTHLHQKLLDVKNPEENFVVVGAGPSGVELAGGLGSYLKKITKSHRVKKHKITIWLVEAGPSALAQLGPKVSKIAEKRLRKLGVRIMTNTQVQAGSVKSLKTSTGSIKTHTIIWTAGTANNPFFSEQGAQFPLNERGRVKVNKYLEALDRIYVVGDNSDTKYSGLALTAVNHANFVAKDILARVSRRKRVKRREILPVTVVPVGKNWAIMKYGKFAMHGFLISYLRKVADYIGYSDILGFSKAYTIWSNSEKAEDNCIICMSRR